MIKEKDKIKVKLGTDGTLEVVCIPLNLNKDSYNYVKLQCIVPKTENTSGDTFLKVYASSVDTAGQNVWTSETYNMFYQKDVTINHFKYELYELPLPKEFCAENGDLTLTFSFVSVNSEGNITSLLPSSKLSLYIGFVGGTGYNPSGSRVADADILAGEVNNLKKQILTKSAIAETFLKYDITQTLPEGITYEAEGFKTPSVLFENATFDIKNMDGIVESQQGSLIVTSTQSGDQVKQVETFLFADNIAQRTVTFNSSKELISASNWALKLSRTQSQEHIGEFLFVDKNGNVGFTKALKDLITKANGEVLSDETSSYDFSESFEVTAKSKEEIVVDLNNHIKERIVKVDELENILNTKAPMNVIANMDSQTFELTLTFTNKNNEAVASVTIDLPLEEMIIDGSYANGYVTLTLKSGKEIKFSIVSLIAGLVPSTRKINGQTLENDIEIFIPTKLSDLADDEAHRTVTDEEKVYWNDKDYTHLKNLPNIPDGAVLYSGTGINTDGAITQKATSELRATKVDKVGGKGLSSCDFTQEEKDKLAAIEENAKNISLDSELSTTSENAVQNKVITNALNNKLDKDAAPNITIDNELSSTSDNPIKNKAVTAAINNKLEKLNFEYNKEQIFGENGVLYIGSFPVYDTGIVVDIASTTSETYNGRLIIACQNYVIQSVGVYGDANNSLSSRIYIKPSSPDDRNVEIYFQPPAWSKNTIHIKGSAIRGDVTHICENISGVPANATLHPKNMLYDVNVAFTAATTSGYLDTGYFVIGNPNGNNLSFGGDGIQSRKNGNQGNSLFLNYYSGNVQIGSSSNSQGLTVYGQTNSTTFNTTSDRRLKKNIKNYKCKKSILDLPVKEFDYKKSNMHSIGCIAQDLQQICPELVTNDDKGYLSIQESKLVYLLLQEVKELKLEVNKLKGV